MAKKQAKETSKKKRTSYIAKAPIRRLMKGEGATLVAEKSVDILVNELENRAKVVVNKAVEYVKNDKRKRITGADIISAISLLKQ